MVNDNRRAEQREVEGWGWEGTQGREHGEFNTGCLCWLQSASLGRHLQRGLWLHQVSECEWWSVCGDQESGDGDGDGGLNLAEKISGMKRLERRTHAFANHIQFKLQLTFVYSITISVSQIDRLPARQPQVSFHRGIKINFQAFEMGNRLHVYSYIISVWECGCKQRTLALSVCFRTL